LLNFLTNPVDFLIGLSLLIPNPLKVWEEAKPCPGFAWASCIDVSKLL